MYKRNYDHKARQGDFRIGQEVLVCFRQEEQGKLRKLSQPWHGPYRIVSRDNPDLTVANSYFPAEDTIQVHQSRVCICPSGFPQDTIGMDQNVTQGVLFQDGYSGSQNRCLKICRAHLRLPLLTIHLSGKNQHLQDTTYVRVLFPVMSRRSGRTFLKGRSDVMESYDYYIPYFGLLLLGL